MLEAKQEHGEESGDSVNNGSNRIGRLQVWRLAVRKHQ
jgi:hypothetical protein